MLFLFPYGRPLPPSTHHLRARHVAPSPTRILSHRLRVCTRQVVVATDHYMDLTEHLLRQLREELRLPAHAIGRESAAPQVIAQRTPAVRALPRDKAPASSAP